MTKYILFLVFSANALSYCISNNKDAIQAGPIELFTDEIQNIANKAWEAATEEQVQNALCSSKNSSYEDMQTYLKNSENLEETFDMLINKEPLSDLSKGIQTDLSKYNLEKCKDTICKAQAIFGNKEGIQLLYMLKKYGLNGSHLVHKDARPWKSNELKKYLKGLGDVPNYLLPLEKNQEFTRSSEKNSALANASITFFDGMDELTPTMIRYTVFHEIAHYVSGHLKMEDDESWKSISHWKEDQFKVQRIKYEVEGNTISDFSTDLSTKPVKYDFNSVLKKPTNSTFGLGLTSSRKPSSLSILNNDIRVDVKVDSLIMHTRIMTEAMKNDHKNTIISKYGETNPLEDIAESIVAYRYNPKELKQMSPSKYEYIKDQIFQGVEYTEQKKCSPIDEQELRNKFLLKLKTSSDVISG